MKVTFFSVAMLAALALFETSQAVPIHAMTASETDSGLQVHLNTINEQGEATNPVDATLPKSGGLTSTFTPKSGTGSSEPVSFTLGKGGENKVIDLTSPKSTQAAKDLSAASNPMTATISSLMNQTNGLTASLMDKMTSGIKVNTAGSGSNDKLTNGFDINFDNFEVTGLFEDKPAPVAPKPSCDCAPKETTITVGQADGCNTCKTPTVVPAVKTPTVVPATTTPPTKTADKADAVKKLEAAKK